MHQLPITIEKAVSEDAEEILKIQKVAFLSQAAIYNNYNLPPLCQSLAAIQEEFKVKTFLKALVNRAIVGSVRLAEKNHCVQIERLVVLPEFQNQGIGSKLLAEIETFAPTANIFQLFTGNKSERNIHLYQKMGFRSVREETTHQGTVLLYMERNSKHLNLSTP